MCVCSGYFESLYLPLRLSAVQSWVCAELVCRQYGHGWLVGLGVLVFCVQQVEEQKGGKGKGKK